MIKFGPSGNSQSFYDDGRKATADMPEWLSARGLDAFEYSFGRGVAIGEATANLIRDKAVEYGIEISVHAPYYINFANPDAQKAANSDKYLLDSLQALKCSEIPARPFSPVPLKIRMSTVSALSSIW